MATKCLGRILVFSFQEIPFSNFLPVHIDQITESVDPALVFEHEFVCLFYFPQLFALPGISRISKKALVDHLFAFSHKITCARGLPTYPL